MYITKYDTIKVIVTNNINFQILFFLLIKNYILFFRGYMSARTVGSYQMSCQEGMFLKIFIKFCHPKNI